MVFSVKLRSAINTAFAAPIFPRCKTDSGRRNG
jgi:hypothetical protein